MGTTRHQGGRSRSGTRASSTTHGARVRDDRREASRRRSSMVGGVALVLTSATLAGLPAQAIDSNPPSGPGNIEIFPKRDMVAIEGYSEYAGKEALVTVTRGSTVIGSSKGTVDGTGFLEFNHPGGECWGNGTNLQVTPDIKGGDEIRVEFLGTGSPNKWDGATTTDLEITDVNRVEDGNKLVITGTYGPGVDMPSGDFVTDPGMAEVEIVNPDMRDGTSAVGERAIAWPTVVEAGEPAPTGYTTSGGVTSGTDATGGEFEVTFAFDQASDLDLAEAGEVVGLAWQAEAPPELGVEAFYGMTLYEYHESSGPGMGGCPAGPQELRPNSPTVYTAKGAGDGKIDVTWGAGSTVPQAPPITGYEVTAIRSVSTGLDAGSVVRTTADGRGATVSGLTADEIYDVEIASRSDAGESKPAVVRVRAADHIVPTAATVTLREPNADGKYLPLVTNDNGDFGVHLDPVDGLLDSEVHYTTDGSTPTTESATFFPGVSESLQIRQDTTVRWIVVDSGNIVGPAGSKFFDIVESTDPAPAISSAVAAPVSGAIDVSWPRLTGSTVAAYRVQAYDEAGAVRIGTPVGVPQPTTGATVSRRVTGLTNGTTYRFTVAARYGNVWSDESALSAAVAPEPPASVSAGADQTTLRNRTVTLDGSGSQKVSTYEWTQLRPAAAGYRDPLVTLAGPDTAKPSFVFPTKTSPASDDGVYHFRLTTTHQNADGTTTSRSDLVDVKEQRDVVTATEARWRAGRALRLSGTASQNGAVLTFRDANANGTVIGTATVSGGAWTAPAAVVNLSNGSIYVWSDHGFVGNIQTTR